jgi:hypothetical protein
MTFEFLDLPSYNMVIFWFSTSQTSQTVKVLLEANLQLSRETPMDFPKKISEESSLIQYLPKNEMER